MILKAIVLLIYFIHFALAEDVKTFSIVAPKVLHLDLPETFYFYHKTLPVSLRISAFTTQSNHKNNKIAFERVVAISEKETFLELTFEKSIFTSRAIVSFRFEDPNCSENQKCSPYSQQSITLNVIPEIAVIMLTETSKPIYKPAEKIDFRLLLLNAISMKPQLDLVFDEISILNADQKKVKQWKQISWLQAFKGFSYQLSQDPSLGKWSIVVECRGIVNKTEISVEKYVLPKFSVSVIGSGSLLISDEELTYRVCAKYSTGKPIRADVMSKLCPQSSDSKLCKTNSAQLNGEDFCVSFTEKIGQVSSGYYFGSSLKWIVKASVIEDGTKETVEREFDLGTPQWQKMTLTFLGPPVYKSDLPYFGKLVAKYHDGSSFKETNITCKSPELWSDEVKTYVTNEKGEINLQFSSIPNIDFFTLSCNDEEEKRRNKRSIARFAPSIMPSSLYFTVFKMKPQNANSLVIFPPELNNDNKDVFCQGNLKIKVLSTMDISGEKINLAIYSKSKSKFMVINENNFTSKLSDLSGNIFETEISLTIIRKDFIDGHMMVFVNVEDEIVADEKEIRLLEACFFHRQSMKTYFDFDKAEVEPGDDITINVGTDGGDAQCALRVGDINLKTFGSSGNVNSGTLMKQVEIINHNAMYLTGSQEDPYQILYKDLCPLYESVDSRAQQFGVFDRSGLVILSNIPMYDNKSICSGQLYRKINKIPDDDGDANKKNPEEGNNDVSNSPAKVRDYFPETWIFQYMERPTPKLSLTAPDSLTTWESNFFCVSEAGIQIALPSQLTVFTEFFIQMTLPYSVIRNEVASIPVKIFNYLSTCINVELTASIVEGLNILSSNPLTTCVCSYKQSTQIIKINATQLGKQSLQVSAQSTSGCDKDDKNYPKSVSDAVRREILVEAEGLPTTSTVGDLVCVDDTNDEKSVMLNAKLPDTIVQDSSRGYVMYSGDILGPSISNLAALVQQPFGCGEQNMITMVPSIYVMIYLDAVNIVNEELRSKAKGYIQSGYLRQLNYRRSDGSFSAFGNSDPSGSTWLTAFVSKSFYQASPFANVDKEILKSAFLYLKRSQLADGCFNETGRVIHKEMKGGAAENNRATLTAYVLTAMAQSSSDILPDLNDIAEKAVSCISDDTPSDLDKLSLTAVALRTYALHLFSNVNSGLYNTYLNYLKASVTIENDRRYWKPKNMRAKDEECYWEHTNSGEIEATGYALLVLLDVQNIVENLMIVRKLIESQNDRGGWVSTQDTVVGLNSVSMFAVGLTSGDLTVTINATNFGHSQAINSENSLMTHRHKISVPNQVSFTVKGQGCVIVKVSTYFNLPNSVRSTPYFDVKVTHTQKKNTNLAVLSCCASLSEGEKESNMVMMEVQLLSGWVPQQQSIESTRQNKILENGLKRVDFAGRNLQLYFDPFQAKEEKCIDLILEQDVVVEGLASGISRVYDYYEPNAAAEALYNLDVGNGASMLSVLLINLSFTILIHVLCLSFWDN